MFGTGGVGGFFGGKLALSGEEVWFVARGEHLRTMQSTGLLVKSTEGDFKIPPSRSTGNIDEIGAADVILFCVKAYDTASAAQQLPPLLSETSVVISLQNGVDNEEKIQNSITGGRVFGGVSYIYSTITAPGVISETGGPKKIVFGPLENHRSADAAMAKRILEVMIKAGINAELSFEIRKEIWKKYIFITAVGGITALTHLTLGEILAVKESADLLRAAMVEVLAVARARGIIIDDAYIDDIFRALAKYKNDTRSSLHYDLTHGKPMELEAFSGTVMRYGLEANMPTPVHTFIYAALFPHHLKHLRAHR